MARGGWKRPPTDFIGHLEDELTGFQKRVAAETLKLVIMGSPVDTGAYRGNHRVSLGGPESDTDPSLGSSNPRKGGIDSETYNREAAKIAALHVPYTPVYIQNRLPYATIIEHGRAPGKSGSEQAPHGVYELAANNIREKFGR